MVPGWAPARIQLGSREISSWRWNQPLPKTRRRRGTRVAVCIRGMQVPEAMAAGRIDPFRDLGRYTRCFLSIATIRQSKTGPVAQERIRHKLAQSFFGRQLGGVLL